VIGPRLPVADDLTPRMCAALKAWPDTTGHRKYSVRGLRIRGLLLPRGLTRLGERTLAHFDKEASE
jgi:hypothetical protein